MMDVIKKLLASVEIDTSASYPYAVVLDRVKFTEAIQELQQADLQLEELHALLGEIRAIRNKLDETLDYVKS